MEKFPFTSYDFYAYLTSGGILIAGTNYFLDLNQFEGIREFGLVEIAGLVALAYIAGHVVAQLSSMVLEQWIVKGILKSPFDSIASEHGPNKASRLIGKVFHIRELMPINGGPRFGETELSKAFNVGFREANSHEPDRDRLSTFINLYGLCRNISLALLVLSIIGALNWKQLDATQIWALFSCFVLFFFMFLRYVKFFAAYGLVVYRAYWNKIDDTGNIQRRARSVLPLHIKSARARARRRRSQ